jgi:hypothetical protein
MGEIMALIFQLDMFEAEEDTLTRAERELKAYADKVNSLDESQDRVRKGVFARLNVQGKELRDLKETHGDTGAEYLPGSEPPAK